MRARRIKVIDLDNQVIYLYLTKKLSTRIIAEKLNVSRNVVREILIRHSVLRDIKEGVAIRNQDKSYITKISDTKLGTLNPSAKLTEDDVKEIRELYTIMTQQELAEMFGVSRPTIGDIVNNRTWKHLTKE